MSHVSMLDALRLRPLSCRSASSPRAAPRSERAMPTRRGTARGSLWARDRPRRGGSSEPEQKEVDQQLGLGLGLGLGKEVNMSGAMMRHAGNPNPNPYPDPEHKVPPKQPSTTQPRAPDSTRSFN